MIAFLSLIPGRAWAYAAVVAVVAAGYWLVTDAAYRQGKADAIASVTRANEAARSKADEAAQSVENCTGRWDRDRGLCVHD